MLLPIGIVIWRQNWLRPLLVALILIGIVITGLSTVVWPHFSESYRNPFFQVALPLFKDGWIAPSVLTAWGVPSKVLVWIIFGIISLALLADLWFWSAGFKKRGFAFFVTVIFVISLCSTAMWGGSKIYTNKPVSLDWIKKIYRPAEEGVRIERS